MKKSVLLGLALSMSVSAVAFASPLTNYEKGNVSVELGTSVSPDVKINDSGNSFDIDGKSRVYGSATVGLGDRFAVQYKYKDHKTTDVVIDDATNNAGLKSQEFNVLYKIDDVFSASLGNVHAKITPNDNGVEYPQSHNSLKVGLTAQTELADKLTGWASVGFGSKINEYEIGLGYELAKNVDFNLSYNDTKFKDFVGDEGDLDIRVKGLNAGITFRF